MGLGIVVEIRRGQQRTGWEMLETFWRGRGREVFVMRSGAKSDVERVVV